MELNRSRYVWLGLADEPSKRILRIADVHGSRLYFFVCSTLSAKWESSNLLVWSVVQPFYHNHDKHFALPNDRAAEQLVREVLH